MTKFQAFKNGRWVHSDPILDIEPDVNFYRVAAGTYAWADNTQPTTYVAADRGLALGVGVTPANWTHDAGAGITATFRTQSAFATSGAQGGDFIIQTGAGDGVGRHGSFSVPGAGANSEAFGLASSAAGANSIAVGNGASASGASSSVFGTSAGGGTAAGGVVIGANAANGTFTGVSNVLIGSSVATALTSGTLNTICGSDAGDVLTTGGSNCLYGYNAETVANSDANSVGIGHNSIVSNQSVLVGGSATANAATSVVIGYSADGGTTAATGGIVIGATAGNLTFTGAQNTIIGYESGTALTSGDTNCIFGAVAGTTLTSGGSNCLCGYDAETAAADTANSVGIGRAVVVHTGAVCLGSNSATTAANQFVAGSDPFPTDNVYFGKGVVAAAPTSYTINGTGGSGADIAGADITIAGGQSTGLGIGGPVIIKVANPAAGTGSALNALVEVSRFVGYETNAWSNNSYSPGFLTLRSVQKNVEGDSPVALAADESNRVFTNEGAGAGVQFNLPAAAPGLTYTFIVQAAQTLTVDAAAGDTIQLAGAVSAASGNCASATVGNVVVLVAINATEWVAVSIVGAWIVT